LGRSAGGGGGQRAHGSKKLLDMSGYGRLLDLATGKKCSKAERLNGDRGGAFKNSKKTSAGPRVDIQRKVVGKSPKVLKRNMPGVRL